MVKIMILLKRRENLSRREFRQWWLGEHRKLAVQLPGLKRACFNLAVGDDDTLYDGVSELWFDSAADIDSAYQSEIGKKVAADSMAHVSRRDRLIVEAHQILES